MKQLVIIILFFSNTYLANSQISEINEFAEDKKLSLSDAHFLNDSTIIYLRTSRKNNLVVLNINNGTKQFLNLSEKMPLSLAISEDNKLLAILYNDKDLKIWNLQTNILISECKLEYKSFPRIYFFSESNEISVLVDKELSIYDSYSFKLLKRISLLSKNCIYNNLKNHNFFSIAYTYKKVSFLDLYEKETLTKIQSINIPREYFFHDPYETKDPNLLIVATGYSEIFLWNLNKNNVEKELMANTGLVYGILFLRNMEYFLSYGEDGKLILWEYNNLKKKLEINAHNGQLYGADRLGETDIFLTFGEDNKIKIWELKNSNL